MQATDIQPILQACHNIEKQDLVRALAAHGGVYEFMDRDGDPVSVQFLGTNGPCNGHVLRVRLTEHRAGPGSVVRGAAILVDDTFCDQYEISADNVHTGFLSGITEAMEEPVR